MNILPGSCGVWTGRLERLLLHRSDSHDVLRHIKGKAGSTALTGSMADRSCGNRAGPCVQDKDKPIIFSMARLDHVKNLTGLAEWFAKNKRLRELCNLVIVGGIVDPSQTTGRLETPLLQLSLHAIHVRAGGPAQHGA